MSRILALTILVLVFLSLGFSVEEHRVNSSKISSVEFTDYAGSEVQSNFSIINEHESNVSQLQYFGIYEAFKVDLAENERVLIKFNENRDWAQEFIDRNPEAFNGPGHKYSSGLFGVIRSQDFQAFSPRYNSSKSTFIVELENLGEDESGRFYFGITGTNNSKSAYINPEGDCYLFYSDPGKNFTEVEDCVQEQGYPNWMYGIIITVSLIVALFVIKLLRRKYLIHKVNRIAEELEEQEYANKESLEKAYQAMKFIEQGKYSKARNKIKQVNY